jgi:hypothetical protein
MLTAELRRLLEACTVDAWDSASARTWSIELELDGDSVQHTDEGRTIAVDGSPRLISP